MEGAELGGPSGPAEGAPEADEVSPQQGRVQSRKGKEVVRGGEGEEADDPFGGFSADDPVFAWGEGQQAEGAWTVG